MSNEMEKVDDLGATEIVESLIINNDLSALTDAERVQYYSAFCSSLGLNPLTRPFEYLNLSGKKLVLYANKNCAEQLRDIKGVSITDVRPEFSPDGTTFIVTVKAEDRSGRSDYDMGVVPLGNLHGEPRSNAMMKAVTKAKRRVSLSICGLGVLDESEISSIPDARPVEVNHESGQIQQSAVGLRSVYATPVQTTAQATPALQAQAPQASPPPATAQAMVEAMPCPIHAGEELKFRESKYGPYWSHPTDQKKEDGKSVWCSVNHQFKLNANGQPSARDAMFKSAWVEQIADLIKSVDVTEEYKQELRDDVHSGGPLWFYQTIEYLGSLPTEAVDMETISLEEDL